VYKAVSQIQAQSVLTLSPVYKISVATTEFERIVYDSTETVRKHKQTFRLRREVEAMNYVQTYTSIPIPAVFETHFEEEEWWILMKRLPGCQLGESWTKMTESAKAQTVR
jgi:aminoglycoside phosphotransferase